MTKASASIKSLARQHTEAAIKRLAYWMMSDNPKASVGASIALLDRGWGKPTQPVSGEDGQPMAIQVTWKKVDDNG